MPTFVMKEATFSVYLTRSIVQYAVTRYGVDADSFFAAVGIEPTLLNLPDERISGTLHSAVWQEAIRRTGDENLGLHLGEAFNLAAFGIVGYVLVNCQTFKQVLEKFSRYTHLFSQGVYIHFTVSNGLVLCDCDIADHLKNYLLAEPRQAIESTFSSLLTATKLLTGKELRPQAVWFGHPCPLNTSEHERIFQTKIQFSMPTNRLIFDAYCLNWSVLSANPKLLSVFEQHAEAMLNTVVREDKYTRQVVQAIAQALKGEVPSIKAIAHNLAISPRQLQRELKAEGTSYQELLDETRKELALQHLKNPNTPIYDVAFLLGFSEPSAFNRAFKRWTGPTPRNYRLSAVNG